MIKKFHALDMRLCVIIPVKRLDKGKSRLARLLNAKERAMLSTAMLKDILHVISYSHYISDVFVVTSDDTVKEIAYSYGALVLKDEDKGVNHAVSLTNEYVKDYHASVILPHDIPLISNLDIAMLYTSALYTKECVVITPSHRLDGTNALLRKNPLIIDTHYDEDSYMLHIKEAMDKGVRVKILLSKGLMYDIDEVDDLRLFMKERVNEGSYTKECLKELKVKGF
jgi:2-phospho-L-lactate guanylyltransferase